MGMGVERIAQVWRDAHPELRYTEPENLFLRHLFDKRSDQYLQVPWGDMIAPYDVLYGRTVSFFFRDIIEELPHEKFQVLIVTRCVTDWGEDIFHWLQGSPNRLDGAVRTALYGYRLYNPRPLYHRKRFHELYNLWYDVLEQHPQHDWDVFAHGLLAPSELAALSAKYDVPFGEIDATGQWNTRDPYCEGKPLTELHRPKPLDPLPEADRKRLKVLCAGLSKTGTSSFNAEINAHTPLRSHHFTQVAELLQGMPDSTISDAAFLNGPLPSNADAISDTPWNYWALELSQLYPELLVVLLERDENQWAESWFCHKLRSGLWHTTMQFAYPDVYRRIDTMIYSGSENGLLDRKRYRDINRNVQLVIPSNRLLVLDVTENPFPWASLRPFLAEGLRMDLTVNPRQPFQKINAAQQFCPRRPPLN